MAQNGEFKLKCALDAISASGSIDASTGPNFMALLTVSIESGLMQLRQVGISRESLLMHMQTSRYYASFSLTQLAQKYPLASK